MLRFFTRKKGSKGLVAIEICPEGISIAYLSTANNTPQLKICEFHTTQNYSQVHEVLATAVNKNNLAKNDCSLILHPDHYKLFFINTPAVPETEIRNAARWQIKDMISYALDDLALDVFSPEEPGVRAKKIYVIAAQQSLLQKMTKIVTDCQLTPISIDIREFATRNIVGAIPAVPETTGFLDLSTDNCLMVTTQKGLIRFVRRIPIGIKTIKETGLVISLTSEIQRSIHYCETELKCQTPEAFFLSPISELNVAFIENIATELSRPVTIIDLNKIIPSAIQLNNDIQVRCWPTIGELLKKDDDKEGE